MAFQGFTRETVDFMWGIRFNNEREWFMAHKEDYINTFLTPIKELGEQVYAAIMDELVKNKIEGQKCAISSIIQFFSSYIYAKIHLPEISARFHKLAHENPLTVSF